MVNASCVVITTARRPGSLRATGLDGVLGVCR